MTSRGGQTLEMSVDDFTLALAKWGLNTRSLSLMRRKHVAASTLKISCEERCSGLRNDS